MVTENKESRQGDDDFANPKESFNELVEKLKDEGLEAYVLLATLDKEHGLVTMNTNQKKLEIMLYDAIKNDESFKKAFMAVARILALESLGDSTESLREILNNSHSKNVKKSHENCEDCEAKEECDFPINTTKHKVDRKDVN